MRGVDCVPVICVGLGQGKNAKDREEWQTGAFTVQESVIGCQLWLHCIGLDAQVE